MSTTGTGTGMPRAGITIRPTAITTSGTNTKNALIVNTRKNGTLRTKSGPNPTKGNRRNTGSGATSIRTPCFSAMNTRQIARGLENLAKQLDDAVAIGAAQVQAGSVLQNDDVIAMEPGL